MRAYYFTISNISRRTGLGWDGIPSGPGVVGTGLRSAGSGVRARSGEILGIGTFGSQLPGALRWTVYGDALRAGSAERRPVPTRGRRADQVNDHRRSSAGPNGSRLPSRGLDLWLAPALWECHAEQRHVDQAIDDVVDLRLLDRNHVHHDAADRAE